MQVDAQNSDTSLQSLAARFETAVAEGWAWLNNTFLEPERLVELLAIAVALVVGRSCGAFMMRLMNTAFGDSGWWGKINCRTVNPILHGLIALMLMWTARLGFETQMSGLYLLPVATSLMAAFIVIRLLVSVIPKPEVARLIGGAVWVLAALNILGLLPLILGVLDGATLPLGDATVSVLDILVGLITFVTLMWAALVLAALLERRVRAQTTIPPSARELIAKTGRIALLALAFLFSLNATGIDLTALAVFGGALGVGIGFGLQKVVGNFISGLILLLDRSIKPGDVIEIGGTYGRINALGARYTSVITRDGTEFLLPNEDMITQPVVNWSHTNLLVRRKIPVQVSYDSDVEKAMALMVEAANEENRVLENPAARTLMKGFGADGIDLELRFWINDPENGVSNIASDVMQRIWRKFTEQGVEFPFPQRVVHLRQEE